MDMQTGADSDLSSSPQNFAVMALQRRIFSRSNVGFFVFRFKERVQVVYRAHLEWIQRGYRGTLPDSQSAETAGQRNAEGV